MMPETPERELRSGTSTISTASEAGRVSSGTVPRSASALAAVVTQLALDEAVYRRTAASFDNADFVAVVIHSYRHRFGLAPGDPAVEDTERRLATQPPIAVPTITLHGRDNGVLPVESSEHHARHFTGRYERRLLDSAGHNLRWRRPGPSRKLCSLLV